MWRSISCLAIASAAFGQFRVEFPADAPLTVVSTDWGESRISPRGGALVLDIRTSLVLRNSGAQRVRGVSLLVTAAELTAGGKASVTVPSLDVKPGETFPVRIDLRLLRPNAGVQSPVAVTLDGVLFDTLAFYGENRLNSRRTMLAWELEARRDRRHFLDALAKGGAEGLQKEMVASVAKIDSTPRLDVQVVRGAQSAAAASLMVPLAALDTPGAPVEILAGQASQSGNELRSPSFEIRNRSASPIRFVELGWNAKETAGGSFPADLSLAPGQRSQWSSGVTLKLPVALTGLSAFVSKVEFVDGTMWVPASRAQRRVSPEEQRLSEIYRRKGLAALESELEKFQ
jgi:hypothetical protein